MTSTGIPLNHWWHPAVPIGFQEVAREVNVLKSDRDSRKGPEFNARLAPPVDVRGLLEQNLPVYPRHKYIKLVVEPVSGVQTGLHQFNGAQRTGTDSVPCCANGRRERAIHANGRKVVMGSEALISTSSIVRIPD